MKYLIVQDWPSTSGNHAGMMHMCNMLVNKFPLEYKVLVMKDIPDQTLSKRLIIRKIQLLKFQYYDIQMKFYKKYLDLCDEMFGELKCDDEVFLLEYLFPRVSQYELAKYIKKHFPYVKLYALSHLTPSYLQTQKHINRLIRKWSTPIDKMLTLGSSLTRYLIDNGGLHPNKVSTGFHYVDLEYYNNLNDHIDDITIIVMGSLQRNFNMLASIVKQTPNVHWIICQGRKHLEYLFDIKNPKISLYGFLSEDELRNLMSKADLSLNVLDDTVGSNVITTSMAMGLGIVVSNVGSIHDYCNSDNAIFCDNNEASFIEAINMLSENLDKVRAMKIASYTRAKEYSINNIHKWFNSL